MRMVLPKVALPLALLLMPAPLHRIAALVHAPAIRTRRAHRRRRAERDTKIPRAAPADMRTRVQRAARAVRQARVARVECVRMVPVPVRGGAAECAVAAACARRSGVPPARLLEDVQ